MITALTTADKSVVQQARAAVCRFDMYLADSDWEDLNSRADVQVLMMAEFMGRCQTRRSSHARLHMSVAQGVAN